MVCGARVLMSFTCGISRMSRHVPNELKKEMTIEVVRTVGLVVVPVAGVQCGALEEALALGVRQSHVSVSTFEVQIKMLT